PLRRAGAPAAAGAGDRVLHLRRRRQVFTFLDVHERPTLSLLRGFSAPVRLVTDLDEQDLLFLMAHDQDPYNRWEAGQEMAMRILVRLVAASGQGLPLAVPADFVAAWGQILERAGGEEELAALCLTLPSEIMVGDRLPVVEVEPIHAAREAVRAALARDVAPRLLDWHQRLADPGPYMPEPAAMGRRSLRSLCLEILMASDDASVRARCYDQAVGGGNLTERLAALAILADQPCPERQAALARFYDDWQADPLVLNKWLAVQARASHPETMAQVAALARHPAFTLANPNRVRALVGVFALGNQLRFHDPSGAGYRFLVDQVLALNRTNPVLAARLLHALNRWRRFDHRRQGLMQEALNRILAQPDLAPAVYEVARKALG
ncbi:MAG: DUF3458 domain-containing protein, partial [Thermodesulfobacteriota bacterium]